MFWTCVSRWNASNEPIDSFFAVSDFVPVPKEVAEQLLEECGDCYAIAVSVFDVEANLLLWSMVMEGNAHNV